MGKSPLTQTTGNHLCTFTPDLQHVCSNHCLTTLHKAGVKRSNIHLVCDSCLHAVEKDTQKALLCLKTIVIKKHLLAAKPGSLLH